jgi:trans-aconitate 2-methyltransferase
MPQWDPALYLQFANERTQPSLDLVHRIALATPRRIVDLGCGPGNSTAVLRQRWPDAHVLGVDSSPEMIASARATYPACDWQVADAAAWTATEPCDLVFANAVLQWIPDHARLCPHLLAQLAPGGVLAVQVPATAHFDSPVHREIHRVAADDPRFHTARNVFHAAPASFYYDLLAPRCARLDIWETTYFHVVDGPRALLDWYRGTGLRPYLEALSTDEERSGFEREVLDRYTAAYPLQPDGRLLFPFTRLFFVARKAD